MVLVRSRQMTQTALAGQRVLVGVSGGIAAYKTPELIRRLRDVGAEVRCVMTRGAREFITPLTLQAVSGHAVRDELFDTAAEAGMGHIELARWASRIVVAPASANLIGRLAHGLADDLLTTLILATEAPVWLAPAMNRVMWSHCALQDNCQLLISRGLRLLGPDDGDQACGEHGPGRMIEPARIVQAMIRDGSLLAGCRFVVTAGPTYEPLDPVRFLGNRSSGRMGFALASALIEAGAEVDLIAGPVALPTPFKARRVDVRTALEMRAAVMECIDGADGFVGVAAVADYRPATALDGKRKKSNADWQLRLVPNPDILHDVATRANRPGLVMGFAAETSDLESAAHTKLAAKSLDLIAANRVDDGLAFDRGDNALEVFSRDRHWSLARQPKTALARELVAIMARVMTRRDDEETFDPHPG